VWASLHIEEKELDNYPGRLAPEFEEAGGVATPFDEWWQIVRLEFPTVPEDVARYWLHEHWGHSPYSRLPSRNYRFDLEDWPLDRLAEIRSRWDNFSADCEECRKHGDYLQGLKNYRTSEFMTSNRVPPAALVVIDNRDGHLNHHPEAQRDNLPSHLILVEGHRRFNLCLSLNAQSELERCPIWLMSCIEN